MKETLVENKNKTYWYKIHIEECVLCGRHHEYRERVYDIPKPENYEDRYTYTQYACGEHFV